MGLKIIIPGRFPGMNEYTDANRRGKGKSNAGNRMKQRDQLIIREYLPRVRFKKKIFIEYNFFEPDRRRDCDNINGYFHKIFQDALVQHGCIKNDSQRYVKGMADYFDVDRLNPRIEIVIKEVSK